ncbi:hypothetical protein BG011_001279 [Mortierella polycephala]|uniref:Uncharacterized protein n=1 Tax=Mortierella polycephala TaxID=41804 RepID=A0A9P6U640_9FUNG|nr:hypothetical protein BG011_001279 [Mortierella polycephala]
MGSARYIIQSHLRRSKQGASARRTAKCRPTATIHTATLAALHQRPQIPTQVPGKLASGLRSLKDELKKELQDQEKSLKSEFNKALQEQERYLKEEFKKEL